MHFSRLKPANSSSTSALVISRARSGRKFMNITESSLVIKSLVTVKGRTNSSVSEVSQLALSKSYHNTIELFEPSGAIKKKVMGIVTDSKTMEEPKEPDGNSIYELYKLFATKEEVEAMAASFRAGNYGYGHAKKALLEAYHRLFDPFREKREALAKDESTLEDILRDGARKAHEFAAPTMEAVRRAVGL